MSNRFTFKVETSLKVVNDQWNKSAAIECSCTCSIVQFCWLLDQTIVISSGP